MAKIKILSFTTQPKQQAVKPIVMSIGELSWLVNADNIKLRKEYDGKEILLVNLTKRQIIGTLVLKRVPRRYRFDEIFKLA